MSIFIYNVPFSPVVILGRINGSIFYGKLKHYFVPGSKKCKLKFIYDQQEMHWKKHEDWKNGQI